MLTDADDRAIISGTASRQPPVEVPLTRARPRRTTAADLRRTVAWLLFGAFGMTTLLAGTKSDPRTGDLIASNLVVPLFSLTVGALVWVALEAGSVRLRSGAHAARGAWCRRQES